MSEKLDQVEVEYLYKKRWINFKFCTIGGKNVKKSLLLLTKLTFAYII
jgi:hypothetical protein